jgi:hypothetical protein
LHGESDSGFPFDAESLLVQPMKAQFLHHGREVMFNKLAMVVFIAGTCSVVSAQADEFAPVKCGTNQERVWVYDTITTFDVHAQIRCNEYVQVVSRVKGYVKVRLKDGSEGYVADSSLPNLPPLDDNADKSANGNAPAAGDSLGAIARRLAANSATAASRPSEASSVIPNPANSRAQATSSVVASAPSRSIPASASYAPLPAETAKAAPVSAPVSASAPPAPAVAKAPVAPPAPAVVASAPNAPIAPPVVAAASPISNPPAPKTTATVASAVAPHPAPAQDVVTVTASAVPVAAPKPVYPASGHAVAASAKARTNTGNSVQPPAINASPAPPAPNPAPVLPKIAPPPTTEMAANIPAPSPVRAAPGLRKVSATPESEDFTDFQPISESADPACQTYFSAYGLSPSQIKWMAQGRKKEFPSICPAPDPSKVDFVVIFTHDFAAYSSTLPTPVHTDRNGFSDFSATVGVDTAALSSDDADKAHRQFVWVFNMKRGAFDPANFSPRRRYQFMKEEAGSKATVKTLEDAFEFFTQQASSR